jgi:protein-L-isoaspartate(D-aspartate) O-methyltransferase
MSPLFRGNGNGKRTRAVSPARRALVREVVRETDEILRQRGGRGLSRAVIRALLRVPRERFVPAGEHDLAYANTALPIGHGQTISQPLIVALMTHLLHAGRDDRVLEIGTGSGYQAAVLSHVVRQVDSVEVVRALALEAQTRLQSEGYENVAVHVGDGGDGWPEHAPYDGILVTAAAPRIPTALMDQLAVGRRLVIPLGGPLDIQWLSVIEKHTDGDWSEERVLPVRFVPFTGAAIG